jgi:hypothetical protein
VEDTAETTFGWVGSATAAATPSVAEDLTRILAIDGIAATVATDAASVLVEADQAAAPRVMIAAPISPAELAEIHPRPAA